MPAEAAVACIDLAFAVRGERLPADYRAPLLLALRPILPWLDHEEGAGIVAMRLGGAENASDRGTPGADGGADGGAGVGGPVMALLARRARLLLRVPARRRDEARALAGMRVRCGGEPLEFGEALERAIVGHPTLHSSIVDLGTGDEGDFMRELARHLAPMGAPRFLLGRQRSLATETGTVRGFSVAVHDCPDADSLHLQERGVGASRALGCGIFVPYKSIHLPQ